MEYGDPQEVSKLVLVAAECMGELIVGTQTKQSQHPVGEGWAGIQEEVWRVVWKWCGVFVHMCIE